MDGPTVSVDASERRDRTFRTVALWICIVAVNLGITDLIEGYHRVVATCSSAGFTCYFANKLWPHRWFEIGAGVLGLAAIGAYFSGVK